MKTQCPAVLAVELAVPAPAVLPQLPTEAAERLVDAIALDLTRLLPEVDRLGLAVGGALFDPAQLLRPGWPVFAELALLYDRQRRGDPAPMVVGFGAAGGRMASPVLEPEPGFGGGTFLALPFVLIGDEAIAQRTGTRMEEDFHERGLAGAAVPLFLRDALGLQIEHARYFTRHDLCALTAIQLDHVGLGPVWSLVEAALFTPARVQLARTEGGAAWRQRDAHVRAAAFGFAAWAAGPGAELSAADRVDGFAETLLTQRRAAALLTAHGLPPTWIAADPGRDDSALDQDLVQTSPLQPPWVIERLGPASGSPRRVVPIAHRLLGTAGHAVVEDAANAAPRVLAYCWSFDEAAARGAGAALAAEYSAAPDARPLSLAAALGV